MRAVLSFFVKIGILLFLALSSALGVHTESSFGTALAYALSGGMFVMALTVGFGASRLLGVLTVLSPAIGQGVLHLVLSGFLLGVTFGELFDEERRREEENASRELLLLFCACFVTAFLGPAFIPFYVETDWGVLREVLSRGGIVGFAQFWSTTPLTAARALRLLEGYFILALLITAVSSDRDIRRRCYQFFSGVAIGLLLSLPFFAAQVGKWGIPFFRANWNESLGLSHQVPGASTSPDALGVLLALTFPIFVALFRRWRIFQPLLLIAVLLLGTYSGSRTFLIGLLLSLVLIAFHFIQRLRQRALTTAFGVGVAGVFVALFLFGSPAVNESLQGKIPGAAKILKSLHWNEKESIFSFGTLSSRLALHVWREKPVLGLGLERFSNREQEVLEKIGFESLAGSSRNFYLQILAEGGLFGVSLFLLATTLLLIITSSPYMEDDPEEVTSGGIAYPSVPVQTAARFSLVILAVLLLSGAHLLLPEIQVVVAFVVVAACIRPVLVRKVALAQIRVGTLSALFLFSFGFIVLAGASYAPEQTTGFYPPDTGGLPKQRWSGARGKIVLCENRADTVQFRFRALRPQLERYPVKVKFYEGTVDLGDATQHFEVTNSEWTTVIVPFRPDERGGFSNAVVSFEVEPLFSPRVANTGSDARYLGVLVELPEKSC